MSKSSHVTPLENTSLLRRFSLLFFSLSILPIILVLVFYDSLRQMDVLGEQWWIVAVPLVVIAIIIGYWGMRVVLKDLVNVVKVHSKALEKILGSEKMEELTHSGDEIMVLARTFDEVIFRLEENVRNLELTKKTLHSVLKRVGSGLSSFEDIDSFLGLIVETSTDALNAKVGALLLTDDDVKNFSVKALFGAKINDISRTQIKIREGKLKDALFSKHPQFISELKGGEISSQVQEALFELPLACAPLVSHDKIIGLIVMSGVSEKAKSQDEMNLLHNIALQTAVAIENSRLNDDAERVYFETISALALAVEAKDAYSRGHLDRVADYAVKIADKLGLSEEDKATLRDAARLHDIGKIGVLDEVLRKPGKLDDEEIAMMRKHTEIGEGIITPIRSLRNLCDIVRHHHECLDGSGYPDGLKAEDIGILTRIISVADIYDALTTTRPYRKALTVEETKKIMREDFKTKLDQKLVETLFEMV